jgi:hypothetical protein
MKVGYQILEINDAPPKWAGYYLWSLFWGRESEKLVLGFNPPKNIYDVEDNPKICNSKVKDLMPECLCFCIFFL